MSNLSPFSNKPDEHWRAGTLMNEAGNRGGLLFLKRFDDPYKSGIDGGNLLAGTDHPQIQIETLKRTAPLGLKWCQVGYQVRIISEKV
jgi:hypothetical protein